MRPGRPAPGQNTSESACRSRGLRPSTSSPGCEPHDQGASNVRNHSEGAGARAVQGRARREPYSDGDAVTVPESIAAHWERSRWIERVTSNPWPKNGAAT